MSQTPPFSDIVRTTPLLEAGYVTPYAVSLNSAHAVVRARAAASLGVTGVLVVLMLRLPVVMLRR